MVWSCACIDMSWGDPYLLSKLFCEQIFRLYSLFYNKHSKRPLLALVYVQTHSDIECVGTEILFVCEEYSVDALLC